MMKQRLLSHMVESRCLSKVRAHLIQNRPLHLSGLYGSFVGALLAAIHQDQKMPLWVICESDEETETVAQDMSVWMKTPQVFVERDVQDMASLVRRAEALSSLAQSDSDSFVVSSKALFQAMPDPLVFQQGCWSLKFNQNIERSSVLEKLVKSGYQRCDMIDALGEFAVRGGIVDVFPLGYEDPVRVEFFDETIENMWVINLSTQRSKETIKEVSIAPVWELNPDQHAWTYRLWDHIPSQSILVLKDPMSVERTLGSVVGESAWVDQWFHKAAEGKLTLALLTPEDHWLEEELMMHMHATEILDHDAAALRRHLDSWKELNLERVVVCQHDKERRHWNDFIEQHSLQEWVEGVEVRIGSISSGFVVEECGVAVLAASDVFPRRDEVSKKKARKHSSLPITSLLDLQLGDYVVHLGQGIAQYQGLHRLDNEGALRDYIKLEFREEAILYVPIEQVDLIQKYIGLDSARPKLHKLGGRSWDKEKQKTEEAIKDLAADIIKVQAERNMRQGFVYNQSKELEELFANSFPYEETEDQQKAIDDVYADMESQCPMDRLICGDVGYGKTEVAMCAAFKAVMHHKQVMVLVPTTVLAFQHFRNFEDRMKDFPIKVEMLSRFRSRSEQKEIIEHLKLGQVDIVIGTHRLLQDDMGFRDLGLLVIDEEQRFGVAHKEKIKRFRSVIDILTMSATPIPRTLYMSLTGMRDMSVIHTPPRERLPVHTEVCGFDEKVIVRAIQFEVNRQGQVFVLHNRVKNIDKFSKKIAQLVPQARVKYGHGQMTEKQLESTIIDFVGHKFDVLVCTTIVESGVDIPNANTIIINNADLFGLADLYQLRGRVGRSNHKAYAYLMVNPNKHLPSDAQQRLQAIKEYSGLGVGYRIAMRDLELRGSGNLLGQEQSGHIARIGFDLYCSLLRRYTKQMKGEVPDVIPASVDLKMDITVEPEFIPLMGERLDVYRRIASAASEQELREVKIFVEDHYGHHLPENLLLLFELSKLKIVAAMEGYTHIGRRRNLLDLVKPEKHQVEILPDASMDPRALLDLIWSLL